MAYSKIRQPKLSDVIEQQLEFLILEGTLRPGEKLPPERELAKQFDVSRPSLREAIQSLEGKGLLLRRQGGGTFVQSNLWQSVSDPLAELLADHPESQFDLLETRHALEGIAAYYAALRGTEEDLQRIRDCHVVIQTAQDSGDLQDVADELRVDDARKDGREDYAWPWCDADADSSLPAGPRHRKSGYE